MTGNDSWNEEIADFFTNSDEDHCPLYGCLVKFYNADGSCTGDASALVYD